MATGPERIRESTVGAASGTWTALGDRLAARYRQRLVVGLVLATYGALSVALLLGGAVAALAVARAVPGAPGTTAGFAVGLALVAAAPTLARSIVARLSRRLQNDRGS